MMPKETPDLEDLRENFVFDLERGLIRNKRRKDPPKPNRNGYVCLHFRGKLHRSHRIIWSLYHNRKILPHEQIDHINGDRSDNRIGNLRIVTPAENSRNTVAQRKPKNKRSGVSWDKQRGKWQAHIQIKGRKIRIGRFDSIEDAVRAREGYEGRIGFNNIGNGDGNRI